VHSPAATMLGFQVHHTAWTMHLPIPVEAIDAESPAFAVGSIIDDKYVVERKLGSGGLGVVVVARHRELGQRVAIKYLREQARTVTSVVDRFRREARIAAQIRSEHVVRVQDVGEVVGEPFIVMEYLEGRDLGHVISDGGITIAHAVGYVLQACEGLAEIHAIGIVHRDLKPDNLFVVQNRAKEPIVKIIDFGISKVTPNQGNAWAHVTCDEDPFGTPPYMSPEQLGFGDGVDCRTDIWALGVVLFELIAGDLPFHGDDVQHVFANILTRAPSRPSATAPGIPPGLEAAILRCLEKDASRRFQNVAELAETLAPFGPPDAPERVRRTKTTLGLAGPSIWPPSRPSLTPSLAPPSELAPLSLPPRTQPTVASPRSRRVRAVQGRARALAPIGGAVLLLGSLLFLGEREDRAGAAVPPDGASARVAVSQPIVAPSAASLQPTPTATEVAKPPGRPVPHPAARRSSSPSSSSSTPAAPVEGVMNRRALYGERE
jgi:serine/threonine protein kinase